MTEELRGSSFTGAGQALLTSGFGTTSHNCRARAFIHGEHVSLMKQYKFVGAGRALLVKALQLLDRRGIQTLDYRSYQLQGMVEVLTADYPVVAV